jgi:hypothetical protein
MNSLISEATKETIDFIYKETQKEKNNKKFKDIINFLATSALTPIKPYLILIVSILIILFLMNCFQFFYYIKYILDKKNEVSFTTFNKLNGIENL